MHGRLEIHFITKQILSWDDVATEQGYFSKNKYNTGNEKLLLPVHHS